MDKAGTRWSPQATCRRPKADPRQLFGTECSEPAKGMRQYEVKMRVTTNLSKPMEEAISGEQEPNLETKLVKMTNHGVYASTVVPRHQAD